MKACKRSYTRTKENGQQVFSFELACQHFGFAGPQKPTRRLRLPERPRARAISFCTATSAAVADAAPATAPATALSEQSRPHRAGPSINLARRRRSRGEHARAALWPPDRSDKAAFSLGCCLRRGGRRRHGQLRGRQPLFRHCRDDCGRRTRLVAGRIARGARDAAATTGRQPEATSGYRRGGRRRVIEPVATGFVSALVLLVFSGEVRDRRCSSVLRSGQVLSRGHGRRKWCGFPRLTGPCRCISTRTYLLAHRGACACRP